MVSRVDHAMREEGKEETDGEGVGVNKRTDSKLAGLCRNQKPPEGKTSPWAIVV